MENLRDTIALGLAERYRALGSQAREGRPPLSEDQFWQKPFPFENCFGHMALHLTDNLNYYVGAQIADDRIRSRSRPGIY